jgi:hypothetical protein
VDTISPLPKAVSTVNVSRKSQETQRACILTSSAYKAQLELQGEKKMATARNSVLATRKLKAPEQILGSVTCTIKHLCRTWSGAWRAAGGFVKRVQGSERGESASFDFHVCNRCDF